MNPVALREILKEIKDRHSLGDYGGKSPHNLETLEFCLLELEKSIEGDKCLCSVTDCSPLELSYKYFSWPLEPVKKKTTYLWAIPVFGIPGSVTVDFKRMTQEEGEKVWGAKIVPDSEKEDP